MATIKDVAKHAGVSISTVSLVLNNSTAVKPETRFRVLNSIRDLQYKPNLSARSLVTRKNKVIGVMRYTDRIDKGTFNFDTTVDTYLAEMLKEIEIHSAKAGYSLLVDWTVAHRRESSLPGMFNQGKVDGVLMVGGFVEPDMAHRIAELGIPTVQVGSRSDLLDYVDSDYELGLSQAVSLLAANGHRQIAFFNGPFSSQTSPRKMEGFRLGMEQMKLPIHPDLVQNVEFSGKGGYTAMTAVWEKGLRPTALVAAVDCIAIGALRYLYERSLYCPRDISVIGFEDGLLAEYSLPPLTTIRTHKELLGREACDILIRRMTQPSTQRARLIVPPTLVERRSVRPIV